MKTPPVSLANLDNLPALTKQSVTNNGDTIVTFEHEGCPLVISPGLARVLLRIMRKAARRRGIDLDVTDPCDDREE
ncbi:MAG: hypothetical protein ABIQ73_18415 [Acidimicrobiales bacterium]